MKKAKWSLSDGPSWGQETQGWSGSPVGNAFMANTKVVNIDGVPLILQVTSIRNNSMAIYIS